MSNSIRITVLYFMVQEDPKAQGLPLAEIKKGIGATTGKISGLLWGMSYEGLLKKIKAKAGSNRNTYTITHKGKNYLSNRESEAMPVQEVQEWEEVTPRQKPADQEGRYSSPALNAISGIALLVDTNEKLIKLLQSLSYQIERGLQGVQQNDPDSEKSDT